MRILILSDNVAPYRIRWAEALAKDNQVKFVAVKDKDALVNSSWLVKDSDSVEIIKLPSMVIKNNAITRNVAKYVKKHRKETDVIIFDGYGTIPNVLGMLYCKRHKIPYYVNIDGVRIGHKESFIARFLKKLVFSKYAYYLCGSDYSKDELIKRGIAEEKICVHNFTSLKEEELLAAPPTVKQKSQKKIELGLLDLPTFMAVGRFVPLKQFDMVLKAFKPICEKAQLLLIGEGAEEEKYREIIDELDVKNVKIVEFMPLEKLKNYYYAGDCIILASNSEVWGMVVNEAMGYGATAVITSSRCVVGYSVINEGVNGYLFPFDEQDKLTEKMVKVLDGDLEKAKEESLKIIRDYTVEKTAERHLDFFDKTIKK